MSKIVAIIQARMGSRRLPGKVLLDIAGRPALWHVVTRALRVKAVDEVYVATSTESGDDAIADFCAEMGFHCFRGSEQDVLDRYYQLAKQVGSAVIVRITADCPMLDPAVVDDVVACYLNGDYDYVSNVFPPTYPDGLDAEAFSFEALERCWKETQKPSDREHVTGYIQEHPERFRMGNVEQEEDHSALRWTVDEPADLDFVRAVYAALGTTEFGQREVLDLLARQPKLRAINAGIIRDEGYAISLLEDRLNSTAGRDLYARARKRIPGGTQLLSKRPEMFLPEYWPSYYRQARGAEIWDLDDNHYLDMSSNGVGACILGYADPEVNAAVKDVIDHGSMATLNPPEEVELADLLCELHPWAEMVRYARSGGEAMAVAVRIARAASGRDKIAFCGYHGWHDWYLAANLAEDGALDGHLLAGLEPKGVPRGLLGTALPFHYGHLDELQAILDANPGEIGVIVMEPIRNTPPPEGFLEGVRQLADGIGAVLVFDEITAAFRLNPGGAHLLYGVMPDIAVFAKAMSNGYPMAAVIGREAVMQAAQSTFISSTYWTERIGPAAALATIRKYLRHNVARHLSAIGESVQDGWRRIAADAGLNVEVGGIAPLAHFEFLYPNGQAVRTLFTQLMWERGFLADSAFYVTYAHRSQHVELYLDAVEEVFGLLAEALAAGTVEAALRGPVAHSGFERLT